MQAVSINPIQFLFNVLIGGKMQLFDDNNRGYCRLIIEDTGDNEIYVFAKYSDDVPDNTIYIYEAINKAFNLSGSTVCNIIPIMHTKLRVLIIEDDMLDKMYNEKIIGGHSNSDQLECNINVCGFLQFNKNKYEFMIEKGGIVISIRQISYLSFQIRIPMLNQFHYQRSKLMMLFI